MRWNDFGRSLLYAAVAAAGAVPYFLLLAPALGWHAALASYAVLSTSAYLAGLGRTVRQGLGAALLAGALGAVAALLAPSPREAFAAAALLLGLCRSGLLYRTRFARAVVSESVLLVAALGLANHLLAGSPFSAVLAVWGFFLVQSGFFLIGGARVRAEDPTGADPFDVALARAAEILEQGGASRS